MSFAPRYIQQLDAVTQDIKSTIAHGWNEKARRFTDQKTGKFLSQNQVKSILLTGIETGREKLQTLATDLSSGKIDMTKFLLEGAQTVKELHILNAVFSVGGRADKLTQGQKNTLQLRVKEQLTGGKDSLTGDRFGFKELIKDLVKGDVTEAQLKNRLDMYADSASQTQSHVELTAKKEDGYTQGFRTLGSTDNHCDECVTLSSLGWISLTDLVPIGSQCSCRSRCKCQLQYR
jgi:hypothetical protein